jgi:hypothetical protein
MRCEHKALLRAIAPRSYQPVVIHDIRVRERQGEHFGSDLKRHVVRAILVPLLGVSRMVREEMLKLYLGQKMANELVTPRCLRKKRVLWVTHYLGGL